MRRSSRIVTESRSSSRCRTHRHPEAYLAERHRIQEQILEPSERSFAVDSAALGEDVTVAERLEARRTRLQNEAG